MISKRRCQCGAHLFVRTIHTALCTGIPASLVFVETDLRSWLIYGEDLVTGIAYLSLLAFSLAMYFAACFADPGYVPLYKKKTAETKCNEDDGCDNDEEDSSMLRKSGDFKDVKYRYCDFCEIQQPMRAKHCEDCGRCVRKYDHHCPWLETCVGECNHRYFWLFLLSTSCLCLWTLHIAWSAVVWEPYLGPWLQTNAVELVDMLVLAISTLIVVGLLGFHTYLMVRGLTTWEAAARERITYLRYLDEDYNPFNEGLFRNLYHFLCVCAVQRWEVTYSQQAEAKDSGVV